ncbi:hypothetical protein F7725_010611, partial [Dissostichus mawsoni]
MWSCKGCKETVSSRSKLLHHYKLKHPHFGLPSSSHYQTEDLQKVIEQRFAAALLKLEHLVHVPGKAVDVFLEELCHLICSAPVPLSCDIVRGIFQQRNVHINDLIIRETVDALSFGNPVQRSIQKGGPL